MKDREAEVIVHDNATESRYEMFVSEERVGFLDYRLSSSRMVLPYIEIDPRFEGRGLGGELAEAVLIDCRARGLTVVPECPFIARYIRLHPEHADLVSR